MRFLFINFHISPFWSRSFSKKWMIERVFFWIQWPFALDARKVLLWVPCPMLEERRTDWKPAVVPSE